MDEIRSEKVLKQMQALPLDMKEAISRNRIFEWVEAFGVSNVVVSFSGGKDSTVLLHMARKYFPSIRAVFSNTGLEYPEIQSFVKTFDNVDIVTPPMNFAQVITEYGYPLVSKEIAAAIHYARRIIPEGERESRGYRATMGYRKQFSSAHWTKEDGTVERSQYQKANWLPMVQLPILISEYCCYKMKKSPIKQYISEHQVYPMLGTLAEESRLRKQSWIKDGCNIYEGRNKESKPLSIWTEQDILQYIVLNDLEIASVYGKVVGADRHGMNWPPKNENGEITRRLRCTGCDRTGCIFCAFGLHLEKGETRFQRLARTHPRQYEYCIGGGSGSTTRTMTRRHRKWTGTGKTGTRSRYGRGAQRDLEWAKSLTCATKSTERASFGMSEKREKRMEQTTTTILCGDAREKLKELPDKSVQMCVTSPPYFALRCYGGGN